MKLTLSEIREINGIQLELFREFVEVCDSLDLSYYMIHGSLLGAVKYKGFFPYDDDIDIAMPRTDYEIFISTAQKVMNKNIFIQTMDTDPEYPLSFAKIRNSETAFIQTVMSKCDINEGIYIDIFPIDEYPDNVFSRLLMDIIDIIYRLRISVILNKGKVNFVKKCLQTLSIIICPSLKKTVKNRAYMYAKFRKSKTVIVVGGKKEEKGIDSIYFSQKTFLEFEGIKIACPLMYEEYLNTIYGDYKTYNPAAEHMTDDNKVNISAEKVSVKESYKILKS